MPRNNRNRREHQSYNNEFSLSAQERRLAAKVGMSQSEARRAIMREKGRLQELYDSFQPSRTKIYRRDFDY